MNCFGRKREMFRKYVEKHILRACVYEKKTLILQRKMKGTTETQAQPNEGPEVQRAQTQIGQTGRGGKTRSFLKHKIL